VSNDALSLPDVIDAFEDSRRTLEALAERIRGLALAEERAEAAAQSLRSTAERLTEHVDATAQLTEELRAATEGLVATMHAAKRFLESADISVLAARLERIEQAVCGIDERLDAAERSSQARSEETHGRLAELEHRVRETNELHAEISRLKGALKPRQLRKLGYE